MILVKMYFSIFSRFNAIFSAARLRKRTSQLSSNMYHSLELCEDENDSIVLLWRIPSLFRRILFHLWNAFASTCMAHAVAFAAIRTTKTREHFAESSYTTQLRVQTMHNTRIVLPVASTIARAQICLGCWRDRPFLNRTHLVFDG